jgi:hypothetical protein
MKKDSVQVTLRDYRAAIRKAWLPIVGRKKLSSAEYELTQEWFAALIPPNIVLKAIQQVAKRAKSTGTTIYSLGVIRSDLEQLRRELARSMVGGHVDQESADWREQWAEDLGILADEATNPEEAAIYGELLADLPKITLTQAKARWVEIRRLYKG